MNGLIEDAARCYRRDGFFSPLTAIGREEAISYRANDNDQIIRVSKFGEEQPID